VSALSIPISKKNLPMTADHLDDKSDGSGTEWEPAGSNSGSNEEMDAEEEEPDTNIKKPGNKKWKKGLAVRHHVNTAVAEIAMEEQHGKKHRNKAAVWEEQPSKKRRNEADAVWEHTYFCPSFSMTFPFRPDPKRAKMSKFRSQPPAPSGLVANWKKVIAASTEATNPNLDQASSTTSTTTTVTRLGLSTAHDHDSSDGDLFYFGGIPSDEEEVKRWGIQNTRGSKSAYKHQVVCHLEIVPQWHMLTSHTVPCQDRGNPCCSSTCQAQPVTRY
jgi:hypothetical protein